MNSNSSKRYKNYVDGKLIDSSSGDVLPIHYPATNEKIGEVEVAGEEELRLAIQAAQRGQKKWSRLPISERSKVLLRAASLMRKRNDELASQEVMDTGRCLQETNSVDITSGAEALEYFAGQIATLKGDYYKLGSNFAYVSHEPLGVVAGIGAWNYPFQIACWKSAPALAAGNAMIFKPSELTPMGAISLAEIYSEAGLPDGVFNVLHGDRKLGSWLALHPEISKISLTGSVPTGKAVMESAAKTLKHVTLELGGKSPLLIFEDAKLENAVQAAMLANFYSQGEICSNGTRVFVHESLKDKFLERLKYFTQKLVVGDPLDPKTQVGALISREHLEKVLGYITSGKEEGAKLLIGGERVKFPVTSKLSQGNFVAPTVFYDCTDKMTIAQEEIFGPVMSVLTFRSEEEAIRRANETPFGLAAGVFTSDLNRAHRVANAMESGICWINTYNITPTEIPFGGYKMSGLGRENSKIGLESYTQLKTVYVETGDLSSPYL